MKIHAWFDRGKSYLIPIAGVSLAAMALGIWLFVLNQGGFNRQRSVDMAAALTQGGNPEEGYKIITSVGCGACHQIPGISAAYGKIGPSLSGFKEQATIAGVMANSSENLIRWLQHPQKVDPKTAMPDLGLTESQARDIAAYLYSPH